MKTGLDPVTGTLHSGAASYCSVRRLPQQVESEREVVCEKVMFNRLSECSEFAPPQRHTADGSYVQAAFELAVDWMVEKYVPCCEDQVTRFRDVCEAAGLCRGSRQWFLYERVLARFKDRARELRKKRDLRRDRNCVYGGVAQDLIDGRAAKRRKMLSQPRFAARRVFGYIRAQLTHRVEFSRDILAPCADAHDGCFDSFTHGPIVLHARRSMFNVLRMCAPAPYC